jgi:hypothetical protein
VCDDGEGAAAVEFGYEIGHLLKWLIRVDEG